MRFRTLPKIQSEHIALLMVDMQNDMCHPQGFYPRRREKMGHVGLDPGLLQNDIRRMQKLLHAARESRLFIVHTQLVRDPDPCNSLLNLHSVVPQTFAAIADSSGETPLAPGSWGADTINDLRPRDKEYILCKRAFSAFYQTELELVLRRRGIRMVIISGAVTYVCVLHTAFDAFARDLDVVIASDAVSSWAAELQKPTLHIVELVLGTVVTTTELIQFLLGLG